MFGYSLTASEPSMGDVDLRKWKIKPGAVVYGMFARNVGVIYLPAMEELGNDMFYGSEATSVYIMSMVAPTASGIAFLSYPQNRTLLVPTGAVGYNNGTWKNLIDDCGWEIREIDMPDVNHSLEITPNMIMVQNQDYVSLRALCYATFDGVTHNGEDITSWCNWHTDNPDAFSVTEGVVFANLPESSTTITAKHSTMSATAEVASYPDPPYLEIDHPSTVTSIPGSFEIKITSNTDWTVTNTSNCSVDISSGTGDGIITVSYDNWFTYLNDRKLTVNVACSAGDRTIQVTQTATDPWITFSSKTKTVPHTGGTIVFENYAAVSNCEEVTLEADAGTVTPSIHKGTWGETNSLDFTWEIPASNEARVVTLTGYAEVANRMAISNTFSVEQLAPYTFEVDNDTLRNISIDGGTYTKEYTTSAPSVELSLTNIPDCISDFTYTQPTNGVGTYSITYKSNYLSKDHYSRPYLVAKYEGNQIGRIRVYDYQLGTGFWLPDTNQTISYEEQVIEVKIHNVSCDMKESNLSLHQSIPGLTVVSYTPQTTHISTEYGILYVKVPKNTGSERTFTIKVDAVDDNGVVFASDTGVKITQLEVPPVVYVDINVDAAYHREEIQHHLFGDWWVLSNVKWIQSETSDGVDQGSISIRIGGNASTGTREGYVYIYGEQQTYIIKVTQTPVDFSFDTDDKLIPVCEKITYSEPTDKVDYLVVDQEANGLRYTGCAHKYPDSEEVVIELNDIFSDTLRNNISFTEGLQEMDGFVKKFGILNQNTGKGAIIYSYKAWEKPKWPILNDPISNVVDPRQYVFINYLDAYDDFTLHKNGEQIGALGKIGGCAYVIPRDEAVCGEEVWYDVKVVGEDVLAVQNYIYKLTDKNYALYYVNAYGGWDSLAIRGNVVQTDNIQSQTFKNKSNGKVKYLNQITPTWSLNTDAMNDGSKMFHLIESTQVYLHNLETDEIIPVVVTDTSCAYKTYSNQGNTRFYFTIKVEAANYKIRK